MMHQNCLSSSSMAFSSSFPKAFVPPLPLPYTPLHPYESPHDCLMYLHFSGGEFENLVKLIVDFCQRNEN